MVGSGEALLNCDRLCISLRILESGDLWPDPQQGKLLNQLGP